MTQDLPGDWRWRLGRRMKRLPVRKTWTEHYRTPVLVGPGRLQVGQLTYWFPNCRFYTWSDEDRIQIGSYTSIADGTTIVCGGVHDRSNLTTFLFTRMFDPRDRSATLSSCRIEIGSDVWLATDAMVLGNVKIGHGAVVAARSVVTSDVPPYAVVAGSPARIIDERFPSAEVDRLLALRWWDWPAEAVQSAIPYLENTDISALEAFADSRALSPSA